MHSSQLELRNCAHSSRGCECEKGTGLRMSLGKGNAKAGLWTDSGLGLACLLAFLLLKIQLMYAPICFHHFFSKHTHTNWAEGMDKVQGLFDLTCQYRTRTLMLGLSCLSPLNCSCHLHQKKRTHTLQLMSGVYVWARFWSFHVLPSCTEVSA